MSEHVMVVSDISLETQSDEWRATCSCGFVGDALPEARADRQADEHRTEARITAAVAAERERCARIADGYTYATPYATAIALAIRGDK